MSSNVSWIPSLLDPYFLDEYDGVGLIPGFNFSTFDREKEDAPRLTTRALIKGIVLTLMAVLSLAGNSATLVSIILRKKAGTSRSSMYTLLFQLAIADLLVSLWCLLGEAAWTYSVEWKGGNLLCKAFKFFQVFSLYLSTSTMVLIGFDRLLAIRRPINHRSCCRPIGIAWGISALLASPQLAIFRVVEGPFRQRFQQCVTYGFYTEEWQEKLYSILSLLTMFVIPLVALIACYACIFRSIARKKEIGIIKDRRRASLKDGTPTGSPVALLRQRYREQHRYNGSRKSTDSNTSGSRRDLFRKAKIKSLKISIIIIAAFILCWAPYYFMMITFIFLQPDEKLGEEMQLAIFFFGMSNSLINPLIYGAFHLCGSSRWGRKWNLPSSASASIGRTESVRRTSSLRLRRHPTERILLNRISSTSTNGSEYSDIAQRHSNRRMRLIPSSSRHRRHFTFQRDHMSSTSGGDAHQQRRPSTYVTTYL